jgi:hypothetical protein
MTHVHERVSDMNSYVEDLPPVIYLTRLMVVGHGQSPELLSLWVFVLLFRRQFNSVQESATQSCTNARR